MTLFLGHELSDSNERHVVRRLCRDLEDRNAAALVVANFHTTRRNQRQIDVMVITDERLTLIELKCLDSTAPLIGGVNGRWTQNFGDGTVRELDVNPYQQAKSATYSVSDEMRYLADRGDIPPALDRKFFKHIYTAVCIYPDVPPGSQLSTADHVVVVGYAQLLDRLTQPGGPPPPRWTRAHRDAFIRHLGVVRFDGGGPDPRQLHNRQGLDDYQRSFVRSHAAELHELIPLSAVVNGERVDELNVIPLLRYQRLVTLRGRSGAGKSHTARHTALRLSRDGHFVIWARCDDGPTRKLSAMLARATAPHSTENSLALIDTAASEGRDAVLVLDGLNECSKAKQGSLLDDLASLRRRHRIAVLITSTETISPVDDGETVDVYLLDPDRSRQSALLATYGAPGLPADYATPFNTPFELLMVAACARDLALNMTRAELFRAYVRTRCPSMLAQSVLREIAKLLNDGLAVSLAIDDVLDHLERDPDGRFIQAAIDSAISSPLLVVDRGRVRFCHELLGRFLTAVELVHRPISGRDLGVLLEQPRHHDLVEFAVDLDKISEHRYELLVRLGQTELLGEGLLGTYGNEIQRRLHADARAAFAEALSVTADSSLEISSPDTIFGRWQLSRPLPQPAARLLMAACECLSRELLFGKQIADLLNATDDLGERIIENLRASGHAHPISTFVASSYSGTELSNSDTLPARLIIQALQPHRIRKLHDGDSRAAASELWTYRRTPGRGILCAAVELINVDNAEDRAILLDLVETAWQADGYHLRLATLHAIHRMPRPLADHDSQLYEAVRQFVDQLQDPRSFGLNSALVDCLAAFGLIEPTRTLDNILEWINELLSPPSSHEKEQYAYSVWSEQFEAEVAVGPVHEAINSLSKTSRVRLLTMAVRGRSTYGLFDESLIRALMNEAARDDAGVAEALIRPATIIEFDSPCQQDAISFHLAAVAARAKIAQELPPPNEQLPVVWRVVDEILHAATRRNLSLTAPDDAANTSIAWPTLIREHPAATLDVLHSLMFARFEAYNSETSYYETVIADAPANCVRQLFEWGLENQEEIIITTFYTGDSYSKTRLLIDELGRFGNQETISLLERWTTDPNVGRNAVHSIRQLRRGDPSGHPIG